MRFNDHDYAEFYDRQQRETGYPGSLLPPVMSELDGFLRIIDIGAGTGFFTIPLAETGHFVTAVEPSMEMSSVMLKKCPPGISGRIAVVNDKWESWNGERHDAAICIHSIYPMRDPDLAISLMINSADKRIIIVRESLEMKSLSGIIRNILGIKQNSDFNARIVNSLNEYCRKYRMANIREEREHIITSLDSETDSILYQLNLSPSRRNEVSEIIKSLCDDISGRLIFKAIYCDNIYIF